MAIAKNYLNEMELDDMGHLVNAVLDMAERMAKRHIPMTMEDWAKRIDLILEAGGNDLLTNAGKVTTELAKASQKPSSRSIGSFKTVSSNRILTVSIARPCSRQISIPIIHK